MALQKEYILNIYEKKVVFNDAYFKVTHIVGNKENMDIQLSVFKDPTKNITIGSSTYSFVPSVDDNSENFIKQGYDYLKTLPEFSDAVDILEEE